MDTDTVLTTHQVCRLLRASPSAVIAWFDSGILQGFRTPGGHRRVHAGELCRFLESHKMPVPPGLRGGGEREGTQILIIDDDQCFIDALSQGVALSDLPVRVAGYTDPIVALVMVGARQPDLILLDIYMPQMNGFEVCRRLRQIPELADVRVVAVSGEHSDADRQRILACGAQEYLAKPVSVRQILALLPAQTLAKTARV